MTTFIITEDNNFLTTEAGIFIILDEGIQLGEVRRMFTVMPRNIEFEVMPKTIEFEVMPRTTEFTVINRS